MMLFRNSTTVERANNSANRRGLYDRLQGSVLHVVSNIELGGIAVQARSFAASLQVKGISKRLLLLKTEFLDQDTIKWYSDHCVINVIPKDIESSSGLSYIFKMRRFIRACPEKIIHFHCFSQDYMEWRSILAAKLANKIVVATLHHTVEWNQHKLISLAMQKVAWYCCNRMLVTTQASFSMLSKHLPKHRLRVVPCGVPLPVQAQSGVSVREKLGIAPTEFVLVTVCRLSRHKGVYEVLEVVRKLRRTLPNLRWIVVGAGREEESLRSLTHSLPEVLMLGRVEDVHSVIAASDLFVMPSHEEGFGLVYAESSLLGIPCVAGNQPQVAEVVIDGQTGWMVQPGDIDQIETAILDAVSDANKLKRFGVAAREHCRRFECELVIDGLISHYRELVGTYE